MNQSPRQKNTPGRRRQGRNGNGNNGSTPQKSYVSENDLPSYASAAPEQHFVNPNTPHKAQSSQKPRPKTNKGRQNKNGAGSPTQHNKQMSAQAIPIEAPAAIFAGATFHASPAPSSLPMPSFLARSNAESPLAKSSPLVQATQSPQREPSPPSTDSEEGQSLDQISADRTNDSPLEVFFRAQRAEKAKGNRTKSASSATPTFAPGPFSPPQASPMAPRTVPRGQQQSQNQVFSNVPKSAGPGISAIELDGNPGRGLGPAFSTPYADRIRAAARPNPATQNGDSGTGQPTHYDESQALLRMLHHGKPAFGQSTQTAIQPQPQPQHYQRSPPQAASGAPSPYGQYGHPMAYHQYPSRQAQPPYHGSSYGPNSAMQNNTLFHEQSRPPHGTGSDNDQISKMEASLRQVLKLDASS